MFHERTKHIQVKYNDIREVVYDGTVKVVKVHTSANPADVLTKILPGEKFDGHIMNIKGSLKIIELLTISGASKEMVEDELLLLGAREQLN